MIKRFLLYIFVTTMVLLAQHAKAAELGDLSIYKVTTYNLGSLLNEPNLSNLSVSDYEPLMITGANIDILSNHLGLGDPLKTTPDTKAIRGFAISAKYSATPKLALQGAFGIAKNSWDPSGTNEDSSWEANLGVIYKFFNNLSYEVHFGYMETGDLFKQRNSYNDVESIIMVSNKLSMSF